MYLKKGLPELGYLENTIFMGGYDGTEGFLPYAAALDESGKPSEWLFDSFMVCTEPSSGNSPYADVNLGTTMAGEGDFFAIPFSNPANKNDWKEMIDTMLKYCEELSFTVSSLEEELGKAPHKRNVIILHPYPGILQSMFGIIDEKKINFSTLNQTLDSATRDRLTACKWFVDTFLELWDKYNLENLNLLGFYWPFESVYRSWKVDDHWLLKELKKHINSKKLKTFWIPFWCTYNTHLLDNYQDYYFDVAFYQPNYMFYENLTGVDECALAAKERNAGFEMEYFVNEEAQMRTNHVRHERFRKYLNSGVECGYMYGACAWFLGGGIKKLRSIEEEKPIYKDIVDFIHERYQKKDD